MRYSQTLIPTMKETPEGAEIPSHVLMLRAGLISQVMAGAYSYLPLGWRSLRKAEGIIRDEMDRAGAVELHMPALTPISLWERSGRVDVFGDVLIKFNVRRRNQDIQLALGPTHEEIITDIVSRYVSSYRQLPITLYQVQTKYRNEERPRFGILRTSEFLMKDAYSFDTSLEGLNTSYERMYDAYCRIFERCGLEYLAVEAESGPIGGDASHEFMVPAENGEDAIVHCDGCGYAANLDRAEIGERGSEPSTAAQKPLTPLDTPGASTIEQVTKALKCKPAKMIKTIIFAVDEGTIAVLVRGDHEVNEAKVRRVVGTERLELADPDVIEKVTGAPVGFSGPVGLEIPIWADEDVRAMANAIVGGNKADTHLVGANLDRDFTVTSFADLRNADDEDPCPRCGKVMRLRKAIEVGHVFKLGTKYSEALDARFLDDQEQQHPVIMGCYGIGVNRILASLIETCHDEDGIIWPMALAPYEVVISPLNMSDEATAAAAESLYEQLLDAGVEVLLDDRNQRPGVKFKDADLIGIPLRVVVGGRGLKSGELECKWRWAPEPEMIKLDGAAETVVAWIAKEKADPTPLGPLANK